MNTELAILDLSANIVLIRDQQVMIDSDIAALYGVETRDINKAVRNNPAKFPKGYVFELDAGEKKQLVENFHRFARVKHAA